jgi:chitinase
MKIKSVLILLLIITFNCNSQTRVRKHSNKTNSFRVVGFYRGDIKEVEKFEYEKLTHLIYCFTYLQGNKIGFKNEDSKNTLKRCIELKKTYPQLKVLVSIGGWGGCETCSDVFSTDAGRKEFAISVKEMLAEYHADGIDIDWESPVIGGYKNHKASPNDKQNFTALLQELKRSLPKKSEISFDANSFKEFIDLSTDWKNVMPLVDFVNLMTYGLPSDKSGHTGHHTALFSSPYQSESIDKSVNYLDSLGVPLNKIVIGAAFYSFVVQNVDSLNNGLGQPGKFKSNVNYNQLIENYTEKEGFNYYWDSIAKAPYLYNLEQKIFVTFDDKASVALKTQYAIDKKLGGLMFWKLNGDTFSNGLLDTIDKQLKLISRQKL